LSRNVRADAQRSRAAIVAAAAEVLNDQPEASVETIAREAGVTRQTVYAHFPARSDLVAAVVERVTAEAISAMDAVDADGKPAAEALLELLEAGRLAAERYPGLVQLAATTPVDAEADARRHGPIAARLKRVVVRGQGTGEFAPEPPADWLVAAIIGLGHVQVDRMSRKRAAAALRSGVLRLVGAAG
jgi:AcrR family transcriptional regulator